MGILNERAEEDWSGYYGKGYPMTDHEPKHPPADMAGLDGLIDKLRDEDSYYRIQEKHWCIDAEELERQRRAAADRIEALEAENERLTYNGIHTCHDECPRLPCVQRREIAQLREALALADAALRGANMDMSVVERKVRAALGESHDH